MPNRLDLSKLDPQSVVDALQKLSQKKTEESQAKGIDPIFGILTGLAKSTTRDQYGSQIHILPSVINSIASTKDIRDTRKKEATEKYKENFESLKFLNDVSKQLPQNVAGQSFAR